MIYEHDGILYVSSDQLADALKHKEIPHMMMLDFIEAGKIVAIKEDA